MSLTDDRYKQYEFMCEALWCSDTPGHKAGERCHRFYTILVTIEGIEMKVCEYHARFIEEKYHGKNITVRVAGTAPGTWRNPDERLTCEK